MKLVSVAVAGSLIAACALPYYTQAVGGQLGLMRQRVPIDEAIADPATSIETRTQLERVGELRRFAVAELALPDNDSYTSFVDLHRDYVVWNVVAAAEFSLDPVTWCFPIAGCVAYRGYFDRAKAEAFEQKLADDGYDTYSGGAAAYSTLGYFDDPVLSTMLRRGDVQVAATLFHELAHQRVYIKDDTELSESFATAVEQYAVERWLESRGDTESLLRYRDALERRRAFASLVAAQRERLQAIYSRPLEPDRMRAEKHAAFEQMRRDYAALKDRWNGAADYDGWFAGDLNNAVLVAITSYQRWVPGLRWRLEAVGPDAFYTEIEALAELAADERERRLSEWNDDASAAAGLADFG
ncbi:MAG: aminopeptidase [Gammaproteobacteria bacterium]|nr:aminopeptidase [Gammaproteobacteria bacterium]